MLDGFFWLLFSETDNAFMNQEILNPRDRLVLHQLFNKAVEKKVEIGTS